MGAHTAQWIRLCLPFCSPGFESHALHLCFAFFNLNCNLKRTKINKKRGRNGPFSKKKKVLASLIRYGSSQKLVTSLSPSFFSLLFSCSLSLSSSGLFAIFMSPILYFQTLFYVLSRLTLNTLTP